MNDDNLKLAIVQALIDAGTLPRFDRKRFVLENNLPRGDAELEDGEDKPEYEDEHDDPDYHKMYAIEHELLSWLKPEHLPTVELIQWGGGQKVQGWIWTYWDGESDEFDIQDLSGISACTGLKRLDLWACSAVADLSPLSGMTQLEGLAICGGTIRDLAPLASLPNLKKLDLRYQKELTDASALRGHPSLEEIRLSSTGVKDFSFAKEMPRLKKLDR